jgi:hypothetical protein
MLNFWTVTCEDGEGHVVACCEDHAMGAAEDHGWRAVLGPCGEIADPAAGYTCDFCNSSGDAGVENDTCERDAERAAERAYERLAEEACERIYGGCD